MGVRVLEPGRLLGRAVFEFQASGNCQSVTKMSKKCQLLSGSVII
jgi:hypothetical protein